MKGDHFAHLKGNHSCKMYNFRIKSQKGAIGLWKIKWFFLSNFILQLWEN